MTENCLTEYVNLENNRIFSFSGMEIVEGMKQRERKKTDAS